MNFKPPPAFSLIASKPQHMPDVKANEPPNSVLIHFIVGDNLQVAKHSCLRRFGSIANKTQQTPDVKEIVMNCNFPV